MLRPGVPGTFTMRSRGKLTTKVVCALGSTCATISVSERCPSTLAIGVVRIAERRGVVGVVHERAGVGADDQVVRAPRAAPVRAAG